VAISLVTVGSKITAAIVNSIIAQANKSVTIYSVASLSALNSLSGATTGNIAVVAGISGLDYDSRWVFVTSGKWIPLGFLYATDITNLNALATTVSSLANVKLTDNGVGGALAVSGKTTYSYSVTLGGWIPVGGLGGYVSAVTDTNGNISVTHNLGFSPTSIQITGGVNGSIPERRTYAIVGINVGFFAVKAYRQDTGTAFASNPVDFYWQAFL
jgi:hypothetical protein